jgi:hypothetical protein
MSTLLTDLDSSPPVSSKDGDLVDQILKEMNGPPLPPPSPANVPNTAVNSYSMGTNPATAHVIGGAHPTPADFAAAMHGVPQSSSMYAEAPAPSPAPMMAPRPYKKSFTQRLGDEFKIPIMVSILFFVFSLPVINLLFARYVPWTVQSTGQMTTVGLLIKSLTTGATFWILQRVVVPLFAQ